MLVSALSRLRQGGQETNFERGPELPPLLCAPSSMAPSKATAPLYRGLGIPPCEVGVIVSVANVSKESWECIIPRAAQQHPKEGMNRVYHSLQ